MRFSKQTVNDHHNNSILKLFGHRSLPLPQASGSYWSVFMDFPSFWKLMELRALSVYLNNIHVCCPNTTASVSNMTLDNERETERHLPTCPRTSQSILSGYSKLPMKAHDDPEQNTMNTQKVVIQNKAKQMKGIPSWFNSISIHHNTSEPSQTRWFYPT